MGMMEDEASFSRSGRSGAGGKITERVPVDVDDELKGDISDAVELIRMSRPTASRNEVVRDIINEDLNGFVVNLLRMFPNANEMSQAELTQAMALFSGKTVDEVRDWVMERFLFGRLRSDPMLAGGSVGRQQQNRSGITPGSVKRVA